MNKKLIEIRQRLAKIKRKFFDDLTGESLRQELVARNAIFEADRVREETARQELLERKNNFHAPLGAKFLLCFEVAGWYGYTFLSESPESINGRGMTAKCVSPSNNLLVLGGKLILKELKGDEKGWENIFQGIFSFETFSNCGASSPTWAKYKIHWRFKGKSFVTYSYYSACLRSEREVEFIDGENGKTIKLVGDDIELYCFPLVKSDGMDQILEMPLPKEVVSLSR